jgi:hypothetical protein
MHKQFPMSLLFVEPITGGGFENFPAILQGAFQQNLLDREFQDQLEALCVVRKAAFVKPQPIRSGEQMIYTRAGELVPVVDDMDPSTNTNTDNGLTNVGGVGASNPTYPIEQYALRIGLSGYALDLNLYQEKEVLADLFRQNIVNIGRQAALSLDLKCIGALEQAYESGRTWATANGTEAGGNTTVATDNIIGFNTGFAQTTIVGQSGSAVFSYGLPSAAQLPNVMVISQSAGTVQGPLTLVSTAPGGSNNSTMNVPGLPVGLSGSLVITGTGYSIVEGDIIVAVDAPAYYRPGAARSRYEMTAGNTATLQLFINAVAGFRLNGVRAPLPDGTFPCYIDPVLEAQLFTDPAFQILTQGDEQSSSFKTARVAKNFGLTFVPTTNLPVFPFTNISGKSLVARRALICAERFIQEGPFAGAEQVVREQNGQGITDVRMVDRIAMVHRLPIDRFGQIMSQGWFYIGGFTVPTDATINSFVIPTATNARYKRAAVIEVASTY